MLYFDRIDVSEGTDVNETSASKECDICHYWYFLNYSFKGALSGLRQFLALESPLKMMKNAFYFTSKALFVPKILKFLS